MAVESKDILEYLGFKPEEINSIDDLKTSFDKTFIRTANLNEENPIVNKIMGRVFGSQENELKRIAKQYELDIDFDSDDFKNNKKLIDKAGYVFSKFNEKNETAISEWKTKAGQGNDEKVKSLETKLTKLQREKADVDNLLNALKSEHEGLKKSSAEEVKNFKLDIKKSEQFGKLKLKSDLSEVERVGFDGIMSSKYVLDLDDDGNVIPKTKSGERIPNPKSAGTFKSYLEVLEDEAREAKILQMNPDGGKPAPAAGKPLPQPAHPQPSTERKVAPRML